MIRAYPSSGSAYTYTQKSINPSMGFMVGWSSWLDYLLSPLVNIILAVIYLEALFPAVNHWVWVIGLTALMTALIFLAQKLWPILTAGLFCTAGCHCSLCFLTYNALSAGQNADGIISPENAYHLWSMAPFWDSMTSVAALIKGATILCFSFTGFDALSTLAEETKDAKTLYQKQ